MQDNEISHNLDDGVIMLDDMDDMSILLSGTITWTNKKDLLSVICSNIQLITDAEPLE